MNLAETRIRKGTQQVGDVEVATEIVVNTTECAKLHDAHERSQLIGEFLDWLINERDETLTLCQCEDRNGRYYPASVTIQRLLAEYFDSSAASRNADAAWASGEGSTRD